MPDRVNQDNVVWFVSDHERRLAHMEDRTEDLGVIRRDLVELRAEVGGLREEVAILRRVLITAAVSVAGSSVLFAATLFAVLK